MERLYHFFGSLERPRRQLYTATATTQQSGDALPHRPCSAKDQCGHRGKIDVFPGREDRCCSRCVAAVGIEQHRDSNRTEKAFFDRMQERLAFGDITPSDENCGSS
jgi:hypothetical protein